MSDEKNIGKIVLSFFLGGLVGAAMGVLFAPLSGSETRKKIKSTSIDAKDKALEKLEAAKTGASHLLEQGKEKITGVKSQVHAAVEAGKEAYKGKKEDLTAEEE